ncbi:MAG: S-ribosylhomocysteine lyase [Clostridia bacterium]|nr:S-ribosylhomocysteine lyase [Clostridia bacterium]
MERITSFNIDHNVLTPGIYLNRVDGNVFTYDLRFKAPNKGDYLHTAGMHTVEHLFATVVRNSPYKDKVVYFGPMGCRTGFYLLLFDTPDINDAKRIVTECVEKCLELNSIPGSKKIECGNYRSHNLADAKKELTAYLGVLKR